MLRFPYQLRFLFARRPKIMSKVLGIVYRAIATHLAHKAGDTKATAHTGAVTLIQRFGSALNLNIHFHMLFLDGPLAPKDAATLEGGLLRKKITKAGADNVIDIGKTDLFNALKGFTDGRMAHIVIVGPNSADAMKKGLSCVAAGGTVVFFTPSMPGESINIDPNQLYFNDISIVTSYSCGPTDTADALELIESGAISADLLITHRFFINDTAKAFELTARAKESLKNIIVFD